MTSNIRTFQRLVRASNAQPRLASQLAGLFGPGQPAPTYCNLPADIMDAINYLLMSRWQEAEQSILARTGSRKLVFCSTIKPAAAASYMALLPSWTRTGETSWQNHAAALRIINDEAVIIARWPQGATT